MPEGVVLVIDDEKGIISLCQRLLDRAGFQAFTSTSPLEGLSFLETKPVDLLLVDIRMPDMDGFEVIDRARRHQPDLAVVVMTGFGTVETAVEALRRGADGLVLKPFIGEELVQSVRRALQQSQHKQDVLRLQALRPLFDITETLFSERNPKRLQELLLEAICGTLKCSYAEFYQSQENRKENELRWRLSAYKHLEAIPVSKFDRSAIFLTTAPVIDRVSATGSALLINLEGPGDESLQSVLALREMSTVLCAPITVSADPIPNSIILAARKSGDPIFREPDLEMFAILARQAAVALENARLHAELRAYIRQLQESQRALVQAEKMAIAGRLTASIAHEINNPLQSVQNCLHLSGRKELSKDERQNYLDMAQNELQRLMHTVQRMLDFYRPIGLDRKPVDLNSLVRKVLTLLEQQLQVNAIRCHVHSAQALPPIMVVGDQLQQVLLNLFLNAIEAMPDGGDLVIEMGFNKTEAEILVEDSGPGVPPSKRKHIFEPFISTKEGGTGLGLAVSYGIITAHGGSLELVDGRGRGACFRITLPLAESK